MSFPLVVRRLLSTLAVMAVVLTGAVAPAWADTVTNDVLSAGKGTIAAGGSTTVVYRVTATSDDGQNNCNVNNGNPGTLTVHVPSGVSVTPATRPVVGCTADHTVAFTFSSATPGTYAITASMLPVRGGTFDVSGAAFTLTVLAAVDTTAPVLALPGTQQVEATGADGAAVAWTATAYDDGDAATTPVACTPASRSTFAVGTTSVTCTSQDSRGNTASGSFDVVVRDTSAPVLTVPGDLTLEATGPDGATVEWAVSAEDLVDGARDVTCLPASGSTFALGKTTVECSTSDSRANTSTKAFSVTVQDTTDPVLTLTDQTVEATGPAGSSVDFSATAADAVTPALTVTCDRTPGGTFELGVTTVSCEATDEADNTGTGTFTVTVGDTTGPALTLPKNLTVEAQGPSGATVDFDATATDLVDAAIEPDCAPGAGSLFPLGETQVRCSATDAAQNGTLGDFQVSVVDTRAPVLTLPDVVVEATSSEGATATAAGRALDLVSGIVDVVCDDDPGTPYPLGLSEVGCSATDAAGNTASGIVTVSVVDTTAPVVTVDAVVAEATGPFGALVTLAARATDAVDGEPAVTCTPASGTTFALGTTNVTCTSTDARGNTGSSGATVTVQDTTPPAFAPADVDAAATGPDGAMVTFPTRAVDVVDGEVDAVCDPASGSVFALGETRVSCDVEDAGGNFDTLTFTVMVRDITPPVLTLPGNHVAEATGPGGADVTFATSAADQVDGAVTVSCLPASGATFVLGTTEVACAAADAAGNRSTGSFTVEVQDTTAPEVRVTGRTVEATGPDGAVVDFQASASDLVDGNVAVTCAPASGEIFEIRDTMVLCSATDEAGNFGEGSATITVGDTTAPDLTLPGPLTVEATGPSGAEVMWEATASDIVDGSRPVTCTPESGTVFPLGDTNVGCSASDSRDNVASGDFDVTVQDTTPPVLALTGGSAEATGPDGAAVEYTATATDVVDGEDLDVDCGPASGSTFSVGVTELQCSATDAAGNTGTGSLTVTVTDLTAPVLALPAPVTAEATGPDGAAVKYTATATDIVDGSVAVTCTPASGTVFSLGAETVSCSASDTRDNTADGSFTVTVQDTTAPTVTVRDAAAEATGPDGAAVELVVTASDAVDGDDLPTTCTAASGATYPLGNTEVTCTSTDAAGNTGTGSGTVTVRDTTAPLITAPENLTVTATSGAGAPVSYEASATDLVDGDVPVTCTPASGSTFAPGTTPVGCSATDAAGNSAAASFTVTARYAWSGLLQPISVDGRSAFKAGSTIPVKFDLTSASAGAHDVVAKLFYAKVGTDASGVEVAAVSTTGADAGNTFRYSGGQYVYNLSTKGWSQGEYELRVDLGDGVPRATRVSVKK